METADRYGLVIFDMDGVLVDSETLSSLAFRQTMARYGAELSEEEIHRQCVGISSRDAIKKILGADLPREELDKIVIDVRDDAMRMYEGRLKPIAGAHQLLSELNLPAAVASSSSPERIEGSLRMTGLLECLSPHFFSATMVSCGKPAPDLFLLAAKEMDVAPSHSLVIEDSKAGVQAGKAAGMDVVGFTGGSHVTGEEYRQQLINAGADVIIDRLCQLPSILAGGVQSANRAIENQF